MKKLMFLSATVFCIAAAANAQTTAAIKKDEKKLTKQEIAIKKEKKEDRKELHQLKKGEVSNLAKQQFSRDFPNTPNVSWKKEGGFSVADFKMNGAAKSAYYDMSDNLVGTTEEKSFSDLPAKAQANINKKYAGYKKDEVILYDDNESNQTDMILYSQSFADADNYFVELENAGKKIILQVSMSGDVSFFKAL